MKTYKRICIEDYRPPEPAGGSFSLKRGQEYLTSEQDGDQVMVFSTFWIWVPARLFSGAQEFTKL